MPGRSSIMYIMNRLSIQQRVQIVNALVGGNSIRATCCMTGAARNTIVKLLVDFGEACPHYQDKELRGLTCRRIQFAKSWRCLRNVERSN